MDDNKTAEAVPEKDVASMTEEEQKEFMKGKKGLVPFFIQADTLFGATKLGNGLVMYWEPNKDKPEDPYLGVMVNDPLVAAKIARVFSEFAQHLMDKKPQESNIITPASFKDRLQ